MNAVDIFAANECIKRNRNSSGGGGSSSDSEDDHSIGFTFLVIIFFVSIFVAGCTFDEQHPKAYTMTTVDILPYAYNYKSSGYEGDGTLIVSNGKKEVQLYVHHIDGYKLYEKQTWILYLADYYNPQFIIILLVSSVILSLILSYFIIWIYSKCCDKPVKNNN